VNIFLWGFVLAIFGLILGSFAGAFVWRLRASEIKFLKESGQDYPKKEYERYSLLMNSTVQSDRSMCLECKHRLHWYDLLPLISWISLKGKCRYCHHKIGTFEPLMELSLSSIFVLSLIFWPFNLINFVDITAFIAWLFVCLIIIIIFAYDLKWFLIPSLISYGLIGLGSLFALLYLWQTGFQTSDVFSLFGAVAILSGIYLVIFAISKGAWIGFGDILIGFGLALFLLKWEQAFLCLFISNLVGTFVVLPGLISGKLKRTSRVPFGPFLIAGFFITFFFGEFIMSLLFR